MLRFLFAFSLTLLIAAPAMAELPDCRGRWLNGNDVLEFTGKTVKKGRFTVEVDYMGMRVSSRGRWMQTEKKPGLLLWKITDINLGGAPGESAMLPGAGDYMFGLFKSFPTNRLKPVTVDFQMLLVCEFVAVKCPVAG